MLPFAAQTAMPRSITYRRVGQLLEDFVLSQSREIVVVPRLSRGLGAKRNDLCEEIEGPVAIASPSVNHRQEIQRKIVFRVVTKNAPCKLLGAAIVGIVQGSGCRGETLLDGLGSGGPSTRFALTDFEVDACPVHQPAFSRKAHDDGLKCASRIGVRMPLKRFHSSLKQGNCLG